MFTSQSQEVMKNALNYGLLNFRGFIIPCINSTDEDKLKKLILQYEVKNQEYYSLIINTNKKTKKYIMYCDKFDKIMGNLQELKKIAFIEGVKYDSLYQ